MKKFVLFLLLFLANITLCSCEQEENPDNNEDNNPPHVHSYVEGTCECGETDPNYVAPHKHVFVDGVCECGETDPDYVAPSVDTSEEDAIFFEKVETYVRSFIKSNTRKDLKLKTSYYSTDTTDLNTDNLINQVFIQDMKNYIEELTQPKYTMMEDPNSNTQVRK